MKGTVHFQVAERIGTATLDYPEKRNALTPAMLLQLADELPAMARDGARVLVMRGAGKVFCGGYDIAALLAHGAGADYAEEAHPLMRALGAVERFPGPTVAALDGHVVGGGCLLAMTCDLRYAAAGIKWSIPATRLGVVYPEQGVRRLVALVGLGRALEILLEADPVDAATGLSWGLYNAVDPPEIYEERLARRVDRLSRRAPLAVEGIHEMVRRAVLPALSKEVAVVFEELTARALHSEDNREGMAALRDHREPEFRGR